MLDCWWTSVFSTWIILILIGNFHLNSFFCLALNHEGTALLEFKERVVSDPYGALSSWNEETGETNPCSWFGIECADGHVISMNLKNMCLKGTLAPELHHLLHIKSIILRNNSFSGFIPGEIKNLKELQLLDLGHNNFSEPILCKFEYNIPILLLDNNVLSCHISSELDDSMQLKANAREVFHAKDGRRRIQQLQSKIAQGASGPPAPSEGKGSGENSSATPKHRPGSQQLTDQEPKNPPSSPSTKNSTSPPSTPASPPSSPSSSNKTSRIIPIVLGAVGGFIGLILIGLLIFLLRGKRMRTSSDLSVQLKRAFVLGKDKSDGPSKDKLSFIEGIPNFKSSELLTACEDFSNVIGSSPIGTIYKGTLSNGVEIAVIPLAGTSAKDWSRSMETLFKKKIELLSKVKHKYFVNLIGYCVEEEPFTRLMVFEYAPNGSLFEHLHVREAEHLDWGMRLRVAMGIAYCLDHMHGLTPPVTHPNLVSSAVNLSEDYAAKLSDFCFWNEVAAPRIQPVATGMSSLSTKSLSPESNVYSFGLLLLEMVTGCIPESLEENSLDDWVLQYMRGEKTLKEMIDPMLRRFNREQLEKISEVIRKCLHSEQNRPTMVDVTAKLKEVTGFGQDKAVPRFSSIWWTELDARSANGT